MASATVQQAAGTPEAASIAYKASDDSSLFPAAAYVPPRGAAASDDEAARPQPSQALVNAVKQFEAEALKKGVLAPDAKTVGVAWFERDDAPGQYVMRVPIENKVFEFPLSLNQSQ
jgi:hypothetical protein